jgi:hypothetical protein
MAGFPLYKQTVSTPRLDFAVGPTSDLGPHREASRQLLLKGLKEDVVLPASHTQKNFP